jgi:hypothetical protein
MDEHCGGNWTTWDVNFSQENVCVYSAEPEPSQERRKSSVREEPSLTKGNIICFDAQKLTPNILGSSGISLCTALASIVVPFVARRSTRFWGPQELT